MEVKNQNVRMQLDPTRSHSHRQSTGRSPRSLPRCLHWRCRNATMPFMNSTARSLSYGLGHTALHTWHLLSVSHVHIDHLSGSDTWTGHAGRERAWILRATNPREHLMRLQPCFASGKALSTFNELAGKLMNKLAYLSWIEANEEWSGAREPG